MAGAAVAVLPAVVRGEEGVEGGEQVVVAAGTRFDQGDAGCRVGYEDVEQAVATARDLAEEGLAFMGEVDDPLLDPEAMFSTRLVKASDMDQSSPIPRVPHALSDPTPTTGRVPSARPHPISPGNSPAQ